MPAKMRILVDERERPSGVPEMLDAMGIRLDYRQLPIGDYIISASTAIERKSLSDLLSSIYDGRLFRQASELSSSFSRPIILIEGSTSEIRRLSKNQKVFFGAVAYLLADHSINLIFTSNRNETAIAIFSMVEHLGKERRSSPPVEKVRKTGDQAIQPMYIVSSLPGVGEKTARKLLERFGTVRRVFGASRNDLELVVGRARANRIIAALDSGRIESIVREEGQSKLTMANPDVAKVNSQEA